MSESNRLLIIAERFPPDLGGVARSAARIAAVIARRGIDVEVLAGTRMLPPGQLETSVLSDKGPKIEVHRMGLFSNLDFSLQYMMNVVEWLHKQRGYRALWGHYLYPAGFMAVTLAQWLKITSTVSARGNDVDRMMFPPGDFARLLWTLERCDFITAVSRDLARKIDVLLGRDSDVQVLGNAVDSAVFAPGEQDLELRRSLGLKPGESVLGFCGELRQKKGLPFILHALSEVRQKRPASLLVIGKVRPREQATLAEYASDAPEDARRILITGRLDDPSDVARHMRLCDVFLQPSVWDGLPNALLEAMACERIVIASDAGGIPEAIDHLRNGIVIPRAELNRLGEAILEILELPESERIKLRKAARHQALTKFNRETEITALRPTLERLGFQEKIQPVDSGSNNSSYASTSDA